MNTFTPLTKSDTKIINLLIVMVLFFFQTISNSTEKSKIIDVSYSKRVTTKKGLNVREQPELNSKSIGIIPYGKSIQIRKEFSQPVTINGLSGKWVYIEAYYPKPTNKQEWFVQA